MYSYNKKKYCLYCNKELKGRSDKRFCDVQCKSAYHNQTPDNQETFIKSINKQLRKNRSALKKACPKGKATIRKDFLISLGMNFKYLTHTWKNNSGKIYFFCYDYGYTKSYEEGKVLIIQNQDYMNFTDIN
jgi:hypothetical protein